VRLPGLAWSLALAALAMSAPSMCVHADDDRSSIGWHLLAEGFTEQAVEQFTIMLSRSPGSAGTYQGRAEAYQRLHLWQKAVDDYTQEINLEPDDAEAYASRGDCYEALKEYKPAIADISKALELNPCSHYFRKRAALYAKIGENELAARDKASFDRIISAEQAPNIDACSKLIEKNPDDSTAYKSRGVSYFWKGDYAQAVKDLTRSFSIVEPTITDDRPPRPIPPLIIDTSYARFCRGQAYAAMGKYEDAIKDYDKVIGEAGQCIIPLQGRAHSRPLLLGHRLCRGEAYLSIRDWSAAIRDFNAVISAFSRAYASPSGTLPVTQDSTLASAYNGRSDAYMHQGKNDLAAQDLDLAKQCGLGPAAR